MNNYYIRFAVSKLVDKVGIIISIIIMYTVKSMICKEEQER